MKIFKFEHSEGAEILAADNAKEAIIFYFTKYQDDLNTDDIIEFGGIKIEEVDAIERIANHPIFNEEKGESELVSYETLAKEHFNGHPTVLVTPNY